MVICITPQANIITFEVVNLVQRGIKIQANFLFQILKARSIRFLVWTCAALCFLSFSVLEFNSGVNRKEEHPYPLSPNRWPEYWLPSSLVYMREF